MEVNESVAKIVDQLARRSANKGYKNVLQKKYLHPYTLKLQEQQYHQTVLNALLPSDQQPNHRTNLSQPYYKQSAHLISQQSRKSDYIKRQSPRISQSSISSFKKSMRRLQSRHIKGKSCFINIDKKQEEDQEVERLRKKYLSVEQNKIPRQNSSPHLSNMMKDKNKHQFTYSYNGELIPLERPDFGSHQILMDTKIHGQQERKKTIISQKMLSTKSRELSLISFKKITSTKKIIFEQQAEDKFKLHQIAVQDGVVITHQNKRKVGKSKSKSPVHLLLIPGQHPNLHIQLHDYIQLNKRVNKEQQQSNFLYREQNGEWQRKISEQSENGSQIKMQQTQKKAEGKVLVQKQMTENDFVGGSKYSLYESEKVIQSQQKMVNRALDEFNKDVLTGKMQQNKKKLFRSQEIVATSYKRLRKYKK